MGGNYSLCRAIRQMADQNTGHCDVMAFGVHGQQPNKRLKQFVTWDNQNYDMLDITAMTKL